MTRLVKTLFTVALLLILAGCSIPEFYLDIHYPSAVNANGKLPIDVFITNSRLGTTVYIESIHLTGELAQNSQLIPGREGLYDKSASGDDIFAEPDRKLSQFETGCFSLTIRPLKSGELSGTFIFYANGEQFNRDISVEVK
jgi:hypothetical protein